jgi:hypothetical protein
MLINSGITGKIIKKILRLTVLVIVITLTTILTLLSVIRTPSFQELAGRIVADYLSKKLDTEIFLDKLRISDLLYIEMKGFQVNDNLNRKMLRIDDLRLRIKELSLSDHVIYFGRISIDSGSFSLLQYPGDSLLNFTHFLRRFAPDTLVNSGTVPLPVWSIYCDELAVDSMSFGYCIEPRDSLSEEIDFNDLSLSGIYIDLKDISVIGDSVAAYVEQIACKEKSGIELLNLSGDAHISSTGIRVKGAQISTGQSSLDLDLDFLYNGYDNLSDFLDSVRINAVIRSSLVTLSDVGYFAPVLFKMDDPILFSGLVDGPISDFSARELDISLGEFTEFEGNVSMKGLPDINSTFISLDIQKLSTTPEDIEKFKLPLDNPNLVLPAQIRQLGFTTICGYYEGYFNDFKTDLDINTEAGDVQIKGSLAADNPAGDTLISCDIVATGLQLGNIFSSEDLGTVNLEMEFSGKGSTVNNIDMIVNGWIQDLEFRKYRYGKIIIGGKIKGLSFDGRLMIDDPMLNLDFNGLVDFNGENPYFNFTADIDKARLNQLNLAKRSEDMDLTGQFSGDFKGIDLDSISGKISVDSLQYLENDMEYNLNHLELARTRFPGGRPDSIRVRSDYVDADIEGKFRIKDLVPQLSGFLFSKISNITDTAQFQNDRQYLTFDFRFKDISPITDIFIPAVEISPGSLISGSFDSGTHCLDISGGTDEVSVSGINLKRISFTGETVNNKFNLDLKIEHVIFQENPDSSVIGLENFNSKFTAGNDSINYAITWNNYSSLPDRGSIDGFVRFISMKSLEAGLYKAEAVLSGDTWKVEKDNLFTLDSAHMAIKNLKIYRDAENFTISGNLSNKADDTLNLYFEKWSLANFNPFLKGMSLKFSGIINGRFGISKNNSITNFFANLNIADFSFNDVVFGDAEFKTRWLESEEAMSVDLNIYSKGTMETPYKILGMNGIYYPFDKKRNFDFDIAAQNLSISVLEPLLSSFSSHVAGFATGKLTLGGTNAKPLLLGRLNLQRAEMKIDYLNVTYSFSNEVVFVENLIKFNDLTVYDPNSNTALLSGGIMHNYFKNMSLDLTIKPVKFMAMDLNRYQNEYFYGKAFATGTVRLSGPFENLSIDVDVKTEKNTRVFIPINYSADISQTDFITFTDGTDTIQVKANNGVQVTGVSLDIKTDVTRDADIEIFLPGNIGSLRVKGDGKLRLGVDPYGYLTLDGSYVIQSGLFVFSLEQLVSRRFEILEGSKLSWSGDIYDAEVNIIARYRLRTDLTGLSISMLDPSQSSQKIVVYTDIRMTGSLANPDISFGISFPNLQEQVKQTIYAVLDTNDRGIMSQQAISLLVLGSFSSNTSGGSNPVNPAAIVSNTLSNMLSQVSHDFNVGINYNPGTQSSADEIELALSTQLLDDRLVIDGNIGVSNANSSSSQKTSSLVGDIIIEYKLTPDGRFRVKAFNRSNDISLFNNDSPYTQGVGIFYRKDFNNISDLFRRAGARQQKKTKN